MKVKCPGAYVNWLIVLRMKPASKQVVLYLLLIHIALPSTKFLHILTDVAAPMQKLWVASPSWRTADESEVMSNPGLVKI